jgi:hypothetical protein
MAFWGGKTHLMHGIGVKRSEHTIRTMEYTFSVFGFEF